MPLPKRRFSRSRRDKRRLQIHLNPPTLTRCPQCGATIPTHRIGPACGTYRGRSLVTMETGDKKEKR
jgi:large subunit ribosomal protein L32